MPTFVTALLNIYQTPFQNKDLEWRFTHFKKLAETKIPIAVIVSPDYLDYTEAFCKDYPNVRIIRTMDLSDTWVYKTYEEIAKSGVEIEMPNSRNPAKDTKEYILLMNAKTEFLKIAIECNPFGSTHFAWIDFNIFHIFGNREQYVFECLTGMSKRTLAPYFLTLPGCWGKENVVESFLMNDICWRFCGGFFIGSGDRVMELHRYYELYFADFLREKRKLVWEVNFWAYVELHHSMSVIWYPADHDSRILEISAANMVVKLGALPGCKSTRYTYPDHGVFIPTSTAYVCHKGRSYINTRYVNYWLHPNGAYWIKDNDGYIRTRNFCSELDAATLEPIDFLEMGVSPDLVCHGGSIYGLEDIRLYEKGDEIGFIATSINYSGVGRGRMIKGTYNISLGQCEKCDVLIPPDPKSWCEKNWIPVMLDGSEKIIYKWSPFEVGSIQETADGGKQLVLEKSWEHNAPMFSNVRGSTPLVETAGGFIAVVHFSYEGGPRRYFHLLVLLERHTLMPLKYSEYFYFNELSVEFCVGMTIRDEKYHFWFSNFDRDTEKMEIQMAEIPFKFDFYYKV